MTSRAERAAERAAQRESQQAQRDRMRQVRANEREDAKLERAARRAQRTRAEKFRGAAVTSGRLAAGTAGIAAAAVIAGGVGLINWPSWAIEPPVVSVTPSAAVQQIVCPGPFQLVGANIADVNAISSVGSVDIVHSDVDALPLAGATAAADSDAHGTIFSAPASDGDIAASQSQRLAVESASGLVANACGAAHAESWIVGGETTLGHAGVLVLSNPSDVSATVRVELFGSDGPIPSAGLGGIAIEPHSQAQLSLAGFAPNESRPVIHVLSVGGPVTAVLDTTFVNGLTLSGAESVAATALPATEQVIPGLVVDATAAAAAAAAGRDAAATLRVLAPTADATVAVRVVGAVAGLETDFSVDVRAGEVTDLSLDGLATGSYSVFVSGTAAVVAAVQSAIVAPEGSDFAWFSAANPLGDDTRIAVPSGGSATVHFANTGADAVKISLDAGPTLTIPAGGSSSIGLADGLQLLTGTTGLFASVSIQAPGAIAALVVPGPTPPAGSVSVYTR